MSRRLRKLRKQKSPRNVVSGKGNLSSGIRVAHVGVGRSLPAANVASGGRPTRIPEFSAGFFQLCPRPPTAHSAAFVQPPLYSPFSLLLVFTFTRHACTSALLDSHIALAHTSCHEIASISLPCRPCSPRCSCRGTRADAWCTHRSYATSGWRV